MSGKNLFRGMKYLDSHYIDQAEFGAFSPEAFYKDADAEETMKHSKTKKIFLLAAVIALISVLVGCGIAYVLSMQDLVIGDSEIIVNQRNDAAGERSVETRPVQVLTFSGIKGSASFQAAQEWLEFEKEFDPDGAIARQAWQAPQEFSGDFDAYNLYSQEQADKLTEIAKKHGLTLAGPKVNARTPKSLLAYLNMESLLLPQANAVLSNMTTQYYENGLFYADFYLLMTEGEDRWPNDTFCLYYYTPKTCFDDHVVFLAENDDWREWNYTTKNGDTVLILRSDSREEAYVFRDMETAAAAVKIYTQGWEQSITDAQLQQMADQINFSLAPQPGDREILKGFGSGIDTKARKQTQNGCTLEVKGVETDGENAYFIISITAPEGVSLTERAIHPVNRGEGLLLPSEGAFPQMIANWIVREDGDGLDNTMDLVIVAEGQTSDASTFQKGSQWSVYIEGLDISAPGSMLQEEVYEQIEGVWQFDISIEDGDFQEVEFIKEPVTIDVYLGMGQRGDATIASLKLRRFSASATFADVAGDLNEYIPEKKTKVVLKDGREITLHHTGGIGLLTGFQLEEEIPLDEVEYVLLKDGTKLYPQK